MDEIDEAAIVGIFFEVRLLLGNEQAEEWLAVSDGGVGLDHLAGEASDLQVVGECIDQRCGSGFGELHRSLRAEVQHGDDVVDELMVVLRNDTAGVSGLVLEIGIGDREGHVHGELA